MRFIVKESELHQLIGECVKEYINEIGDTHKYGKYGLAMDASKKAKKLGRTTQADNLMRHGIKAFNDKYSFSNKNKPASKKYDNNEEFDDFWMNPEGTLTANHFQGDNITTHDTDRMRDEIPVHRAGRRKKLQQGIEDYEGYNNIRPANPKYRR